MNNLDEISRLLGNIEAKQTIANGQLEALFKRVDDIRKEQAETLGIVKELNSRVDLLENELAQDVVPTVQEVQRLKQRGIGILTTIGLLSAGAGYLLNKGLKYFFNI